MTGLLLTIMVGVCEIVNFLVLISSKNVIDIVINFMGLVVITEFEDFLSESVRDENVKKMINTDEFRELLLVITRTSSRKAMAKIPGNRIQDVKLNEIEQKQFDLKIPKYIGISKRTKSAKCKYVIYKFFRVLYVSVWFYFLPFILLFG
jgi:hypothetical protein